MRFNVSENEIFNSTKNENFKFVKSNEVHLNEAQSLTLTCEVPNDKLKLCINTVCNNQRFFYLSLALSPEDYRITQLKNQIMQRHTNISIYPPCSNFSCSFSFMIENKSKYQCGLSTKYVVFLKNNKTLGNFNTQKELLFEIVPVPKNSKYSSKYSSNCLNNEFLGGINRIIKVQCSQNKTNLETTYKLISPFNHTLFENSVGIFNMNIVSRADFGVYVCLAQNTAGNSSCKLNLKMGDYPEPPVCMIESKAATNELSIKPGFNQGGTYLDIFVYSIGYKMLYNLTNINEELKVEKIEINLTDIDHLVVYQKNNYGDSKVCIINKIDSKEKYIFNLEVRNFVILACAFLLIILAFFALTCCCCRKISKIPKQENIK